MAKREANESDWQESDELCANCGHPKSAHSGGTGECFYQGGPASASEPCSCRSFSEDDD